MADDHDCQTLDAPQEFINGYDSSGDNGDGRRLVVLEQQVREQQLEIEGLKDKLAAVLSRVDSLEQSKVNGTASRNIPAMGRSIATPRSAPASGRRQTMDPRQLKTERPTSPVSKTEVRKSMAAPPPPMAKRLTSKDKLPVIKDEHGTYRMHLKGRPVTFLLPEGYVVPAEGTAPPEAPEKRLQLEWVYGYRGKDCRNNVFVLANGEILYFTAAVCVLQNLATGTQRHYLEHSDDIRCLAVHPDRKTIASGQVAGHDRVTSRKGKASSAAATTAAATAAAKAPSPSVDFLPHVRIWSSETLETLKIVGVGSFDRAVACVAFCSGDGTLLCAVDEHNDHRLSVWEWSKGPKGNKLAELKASQDPVFQAEFHPADKNQIICCGKNQLSFWSLEGKTLKKQMALFEKQEKPKFVTCFTFNHAGDVISGDSNGSIFVWGKGGNKITAAITGAHDGPIFSLFVQEDGTIMSGGGKDGKVKSWDLANKVEVDCKQLAEQYGAVRVIIKSGESHVIGTTKNLIVEGSVEHPRVVAKGHGGELWGLTAHPTADRFITCAYDSRVKLWNATDHCEVWDIELPEALHCVTHHPSADVIAIGSKTSNWYLYNTNTQQQVFADKCGIEQLECVEFSPDGSYLAFGSRDNNIYLYKVNLDEQSCSLVGKCLGHTSFLTHLDWSVDGGAIRSNSGDYELLFWEVPACKQLTDGEKIRNLEWATQNCTLSFNTVGIWSGGADGTDINACCRNKADSLLASADDFGKVNLYTYPCRQPDAQSFHYSGHSSHVTAVRFLSSDISLVSTGGKDATVMQWKVI